MSPSNDNQVDKFSSGVKMYGTEERGMVLILSGDLPPARFKDHPGKHHIIQLDMNNPARKDGAELSAEIQRKMAMAIENSKPFKQGRVFYLKSPEEMAEEKKREEQKKFREELIHQLSGGVIALNLERTVDELCELAEKIGAVYLDKNGKKSMKHAIQKNIRDALGIADEKPMPAEVDEGDSQKSKQKSKKEN